MWRVGAAARPTRPTLALLSPLLLALACPRAAADETRRWLGSRSLADFMDLDAPAGGLALDIALNVVLIGFSGEGAAGVNVSAADMYPWLDHLRRDVPPATIPPSDPRAEPAVVYRPSVHAYVMPPSVCARVDELLASQLRPDELATTPPRPSRPVPLQMNGHAMSALLDSLGAHLGLGGYTLYVLNPRVESAGKRAHGYRRGFSPSELAWLGSSDEVRYMLQSAPETGGPPREHAPRLGSAFFHGGHGGAHGGARGGDGDGDARAAPRGVSHAARSLGATEASALGAEWAEKWPRSDAMASNPLLRPDAHGEISARGAAATVLPRVLAIVHDLAQRHHRHNNDEPHNNGEDDDDRIAALHTMVRQVSHAARGDPPPDECLTDVWVSSRRHAFIDMSAGHFSWGPAHFAEEFAEGYARVEPSVGREGDLGDLGELSENGPSAEDLASERSVLHEVMRRACARVDGAAANLEPPADPDPADPSDAPPAALCDNLRSRLAQFDTYAQELQTSRAKSAAATPTAASAAARRPQPAMLAGGRLAPDGLARLGAAAAGLMRTVLLPPISALGPRHAEFAERVSIHLYLARARSRPPRSRREIGSRLA